MVSNLGVVVPPGSTKQFWGLHKLSMQKTKTVSCSKTKESANNPTCKKWPVFVTLITKLHLQPTTKFRSYEQTTKVFIDSKTVLKFSFNHIQCDILTWFVFE